MATVLKYWDEAAGEWKMFTGDVPPPTSSLVIKGDVVGTKDGTNMAFSTGVPYIAGTLVPYWNGTPQFAGVVETNPATGAFTLDVAPAAADTLKVYFHVANTGVWNADTLDTYHASPNPAPNTILPLNASGKFPQSVLAGVKVTNVGSVNSPALGAGSGGNVAVTLANVEPDTNYHVFFNQSGDDAYWTWLEAKAASKTTTGFTVNFYNNGAGTSAAIPFSYMVVRS